MLGNTLQYICCFNKKNVFVFFIKVTDRQHAPDFFFIQGESSWETKNVTMLGNRSAQKLINNSLAQNQLSKFQKY